jgi:hypothetical protein
MVLILLQRLAFTRAGMTANPIVIATAARSE